MAAFTTAYQFIAVDKFSKTVTRMNTVLATTKKRMANITESAASFEGMAAGVATGLLGANILRAGATFEAAMDNVAATSGAVGKDFEALTLKAKELGSQTKFTATEAADAMNFLALAGYNTKQILDAVPATLDLAAAGGMDLARASDIASDLTTAFGFAAKDTIMVVDQLAKTQASFNTTIEQTFEAMKYMVPASNTLKISMEETNAMIGLMANRGLKGGIATRALATAMFRLAKPTAEMQDLQRALGISFFDNEGKFIGMTQTLNMMNKVMKNFTQEQRAATISILFGAEAIKSIDALLLEGGANLEKYTQVVKDSAGAAEKMATIKTRGVLGAFIELKSAVEFAFIELSTAVFDDLNKMIRSTSDYIRQMGRGFQDLSPEMKKFISYSVGLLLVAAPLGLALAALIISFSAIAKVIGGVFLGFKAMGAILPWVGLRVALLNTGMLTFSTVFAGIVVAVAGSIAIFYSLKAAFTALFGIFADADAKLSDKGKQAVKRYGLDEISADDLRNMSIEELRALRKGSASSVNVNSVVESNVNLTGLPAGMNAAVNTGLRDKGNLGKSMGY